MERPKIKGCLRESHTLLIPTPVCPYAFSPDSGNSVDFRPKENRSVGSRFAELSAAAVSEGQGTCGIPQWSGT
jgi:hypothetical protein